MKTKLYSLALASSLLTVSCADSSSDDATPNRISELGEPGAAADLAQEQQTTVEILAADERFSTLVSLVQQAGLVETINGGEFTIFAPTNEAFAALDAETLEAVGNDTELLTKVLTYHVVPGSLRAADVLASNSLASVESSDIKVSSNEDAAFVNNSKIIETDLVATNGVVHVIDSVLMPMDDAPGTIVDIAVGAEDFSILTELVVEAGLQDLLASEGPFTVFAPNNAAFEKLPEGTIETLKGDKELLTKILSYHVVPGSLTADKVLAESNLTSANELTLNVSSNEEGAFINDSKIITTDIIASNGVVHAIDTVLMPMTEAPENDTIVDIAAGNEDFSILVDLVVEAGLAELLSGEGPFTVFAPTNAAFEKIPAKKLEEIRGDKDLLTKILTYHVVPKKLLAEDVLDMRTIRTANHLRLHVRQNKVGAFINNSQIIDTNIVGDNGVIHVIDAVLIP